uniref:Uncharacterized protein n=1 Tax=Arundo donax TaxID=35708 RepID=A0A0A8ZQW1_ARUDO
MTTKELISSETLFGRIGISLAYQKQTLSEGAFHKVCFPRNNKSRFS